MKRIIYALVAVMAINTVSQFSCYAKGYYKDIDENSQYAEAVNKLTELKIIDGFDDERFHPDEYITRAEVTKLLVGIYDKIYYDKKYEEYTFKDVDDTHWAKTYIDRGYSWHLIQGYDDESFRPNQVISYAEIVTLIMRMLCYDDICEAYGGYPEGYMIWGKNSGVTEGYENMNYDSYMTRADVAQLLYNSLYAKSLIDVLICVWGGVDVVESKISHLENEAHILLDDFTY